MNIPDSIVLRKAIAIKTEIERLEQQLQELFSSALSQDTATVSPLLKKSLKRKTEKGDNFPHRETSDGISTLEKKRRGPVKGKPRAVSPSGPLEDAILEVLKQSEKPMKVTEVFEALEKRAYQWTTKHPMQLLYIRMPKLSGIIRDADNRYTIAPVAEEQVLETPTSAQEEMTTPPASPETNSAPLLLVDDSGEEPLAIIQTEEILECILPVTTEESPTPTPETPQF